MRFHVVFRVVGVVNIVLAIAMLAPLTVSYYYQDGEFSFFLNSIIITGLSGLALFLFFRATSVDVSHREGFVIVAFSWLTASLFSSMPFLLSGEFPSVVDAIFEATSGITTTGASILTDIESLPESLLFWRSLMNWMGGMGIVLLGLAILPLLGIGGMQLYKAEASVVSSDKFAPRMREMARILFGVYLGLSGAVLLLLYTSGMSLYDATLHMFTSVSTAGFSPKNESIAAFGSIYVEMLLIIAMILGATSFSLHYRLFSEGPKAYKDNGEFRFYLSIIALSTLVLTFSLKGVVYNGLGESLRYAAFQVTSIMTTTGYSSADFASWPVLSQLVLFTLMFFGGSVGSTTGSIKCIRMLLLIKIGHREIKRLLHPHAVVHIKLGGKVVPKEVLNSVMGFTFLFLTVFAASSIAISAFGLDLVSAVSGAAATLCNVGPALGDLGPASNYALVPDGAKWIMIFNMLLGRLEIYTLLVLLLPSFWRG